MDQREQELERFREAVDHTSEQAGEAAESDGDSAAGADTAQRTIDRSEDGGVHG